MNPGALERMAHSVVMASFRGTVAPDWVLARLDAGLGSVALFAFALGLSTLIDLAAGGTPVDLEFAYTLSTQAKLVLTAHEVYLPKPKLAVEGWAPFRRASTSAARRTTSQAGW